jgi:Electron transfer flavoprotein domain
VPTEPSLFALSESRRGAHDAGVTVFAVVICDPRPEEETHAIASRLGVAGADKVLLCEGPGLDAPALDATHGLALHTAAERVPPLLVLFPAGGAGPQLGPPLAVRLGAAFAAAADIEVSDTPTPLPDGLGRVVLRRWRRDLSAYRRLDPVEIGRPVIAVLGAQGAPRDTGTADVEVQVIACPTPTAAKVVELESTADEDAALALARVLIMVSPQVGPELLARLVAAAPPGVGVADLARVPPAVLAMLTPRIVLSIEASASTTAPSPRTRIGMILRTSPDASALGRSDVLWRGHGETAWDELCAALPQIAVSDGGARGR